jgi:hypothetical protein
MNELFKYLVQETNAVRTANNIIVKFVFWVNCAALTISFVDFLGYPIDEYFTFNVGGIIKLFSRHYLVAGLMFYLILNFLIRIFGDLITALFTNLYRIWFLIWYSRSKTILQLKEDYIQDFLNHQVAEDNDTLIRKTAIAKENELSIRNFTEMVLTLPIIYSFIINIYFPNAYSDVVTTLMWLFVVIVFRTRAKMKFRGEIPKAWKQEIDKYLKTTTGTDTATTTTTTTTSPEPN